MVCTLRFCSMIYSIGFVLVALDWWQPLQVVEGRINALINVWTVFDHYVAGEAEDVPVLSANLAYGL